jgi:branched-subunit amino acid aminotransferase/4-amino-4-deoxychorismate lyase
VFDSVVQGGDAVWEGLRIYDGKVFKLEEHLDRCSDCSIYFYLAISFLLMIYAVTLFIIFS